MEAAIRTGLNPSSSKELKKFGWTVGAVFVGVFGLALPLLLARPIPRWPFWIGVPLIAFAFLFPRALQPVHFIWMKFAHALGWFNTRVLLGVLFFVVFTPFSLLLRLCKKVPLQLGWRQDRSSYWSKPSDSNHKFERPF